MEATTMTTPSRSGRGATAAAKDRARIREMTAVRLRAMGHTYQQIAQHRLPCPAHDPADPDCPDCAPLYGHRAGALRAVERALAVEYATGSEQRDGLRREALASVNLLLTRIMRDALGDGDDRHKAAANAVRAMERKARLLGLDAPLRVQVDDELDSQIDAALAELTAAAAAGLLPTGPSDLS